MLDSCFTFILMWWTFTGTCTIITACSSCRREKRNRNLMLVTWQILCAYVSIFPCFFLIGFASKKFSEIFSKAFLIPLDESDNFFRLEVGPQIMHSLHEKKNLIWAKNVNYIMAQASSTSGRFYETDMKCQKVLYVKSLVVNASARTMDLIGCVNIHANFGIKHRNDIGCIIM